LYFFRKGLLDVLLELIMMTKEENSKWIVILMKIMHFKTMMLGNLKTMMMMEFYKTKTMMENFRI